MEKILSLQRQLFRSRRSALTAIALTLLILACAIFAVQMGFRHRMRAQIAQQEAEILQAIALLQHQADEASGEFVDSAEGPESYFDEMLKISKLRGVIAVRLFDKEGAFVNAFPSFATEGGVSDEDFSRLKNLQPVSHFYPRASLQDIDLLSAGSQTSATAPILEVSITLTGRAGLSGIAQFLMEGGSVAAACAELDRDLLLEGLAVFLGCGTLLALSLVLAFHRIQKMNTLLFEANQELALAGRTSAVGAIASHLIHGLKNPLSGLQNFVSGQSAPRPGSQAPDWQAAIATTQRMQALVNEVVRILHEQQAGAAYELSAKELSETLTAKMLPMVCQAGVSFQTAVRSEFSLSSRDANLLGLVLENLIQNALQVTPKGKTVRLTVFETLDALNFEVLDEGPGFPPELIGMLFKPCRSTKPGGGGIGLAISKQLAAQLDASLQLKATSSSGCVFSLSFPKSKAEPQKNNQP